MHDQDSNLNAPAYFDLRTGVEGDSQSQVLAWKDGFAARSLGMTLAEHTEFWDHVELVREDHCRVGRLAARYIRRNRSHHKALIARCLVIAAEVPTQAEARNLLHNLGTEVACWVEAPLPKKTRRLRPDIADSIAIGAVRVARRGAGRCVAHDCSADGGKVLSRYATDYCGICEGKLRRPSEAERGEYELLNRASRFVLQLG